MCEVCSTDAPPGSPANPPVPPAGRPVHRILRNSALNLGSQVFSALCYVAVFFILARALGKEGLGRYYTVFAITVAVQLVMEGGISTVLTHRIAQAPASWRQLFAEAAGMLSLTAAASSAGLLLMGLGWTAMTADLTYLVCFAAAGVSCAAIQVRRFCAATFYAFERFREESFARSLQAGGFLIFVAALAMLRLARLETALAALAISQVLAAGYLLAELQRRWRCLALRLNGSIARDWLGQAVPLGAGDVLRELTLQLGTLLLGLLQPAVVVGIYSMAYRPLNPLNLLPQAVLLAAFPSFSRLALSDRQQLSHAFSNSIRLLWVISVPIAVAIFVCAEPLVLVLGGPQYAEAILPMRMLIWIITLYYLSIQFRFLFAALGKQRTYVRLVALVFMIELVAGSLLIPRWGYLGACAGSLLGELLLTSVGFWLCYRLGIRAIDWGAMFRAAVGGMAVGVILWFARESTLPTLLFSVIVLAGFYFALCIIVRAVRRQEVYELYAALTRILRTTGQ